MLLLQAAPCLCPSRYVCQFFQFCVYFVPEIPTLACVRVCVCVCVRARARACMRACVRACVGQIHKTVSINHIFWEGLPIHCFCVGRLMSADSVKTVVNRPYLHEHSSTKQYKIMLFLTQNALFRLD